LSLRNCERTPARSFMRHSSRNAECPHMLQGTDGGWVTAKKISSRLEPGATLKELRA
jgi:hypothetical protein